MLSHTACSQLLKSIDKSVAILDRAKDQTLGEELLRMAILRVEESDNHSSEKGETAPLNQRSCISESSLLKTEPYCSGKTNLREEE
jgi:hypothetical protein